MPNPPKYRRDPRVGTVIRIPLEDGFWGYAVKVNEIAMWLFDFVTKEPMEVTKLFAFDRLKWAVRFMLLPETFIDCGKLTLPKDAAILRPRFYEYGDDEGKEWFFRGVRGPWTMEGFEYRK